MQKWNRKFFILIQSLRSYKKHPVHDKYLHDLSNMRLNNIIEQILVFDNAINKITGHNIRIIYLSIGLKVQRMS